MAAEGEAQMELPHIYFYMYTLPKAQSQYQGLARI